LDWFEEGGIVDVSGCFVPLEMDRFVDVEGVPTISPLAQLAVSVNVELRLDDGVLKMIYLLFGWP
jgi:hypothetical protein